MAESKTDSPADLNDSVSKSGSSNADTIFSDDAKDYKNVKECLAEYILFGNFLKALKINPDDFQSFYNLRLKIFQILNQCVVANCTEWSMHSAGFDKSRKPIAACINHFHDINTDGQIVLYEDDGEWYVVEKL